MPAGARRAQVEDGADGRAVRRRVFVLGSGFSAAMGLPTLRGLFETIMGFPGDRDDKRRVHDGLKRMYPHFRRAGQDAYPPLEHFLTLVDAAIPHPGYEEHYWPGTRKSTIRLLTDYFGSRSQECEGAELLREFTQGLRDGDVVVTFNWDNLVERSLSEQKRSINFRERDASGVAVLKLHGSLNWSRVPKNVQVVDGDLGQIEWMGEGVFFRRDFSYCSNWNALDEPPLIVPPGAAKSPLTDLFLRDIWREAFYSLIEGNPIWIIGYSLPTDDPQARALLRSSLASKVRYHVVDPDLAIGERYFGQVGPQLEFLNAPFTKDLLQDVFRDESVTPR